MRRKRYVIQKQVASVGSMAESDRIVKLLGQSGITAYVKSKDNFSGGLFENRRGAGTFGMDAQARFLYQIYVKNDDYEKAKSILG